MTDPTPKSFRLKAACVILLAVVVRVAFVAAVGRGVLKTEFNPDSWDYISFAYNLATGVGFAHAVNDSQPFSQPVEFSASRAPLYPMFLAAAFQFSREAWFLRSLQIAVAAASVYLFLRLGLVLFGELPALIAGMAMALYPPLIMFSVDLDTENLFLFLLIAGLYVLCAAAKGISPARVFGFGVLVGLAALCRPGGLMLIPAFTLAILLVTRDWGRSLRMVIVLGIAVAMIVLPWTYRNYRLFHEFVPITTNGGLSLWGGAHLRLEPGAKLDDLAYALHRELRDVPEPERDRYYYHRAFVILDHSPRLFGEMLLRNFAAMYNPLPSALYHRLRIRLVYSLSYIPLLVSGVIGFWMLRRRWRELSLLWAWVFTDTVFYCFYYGQIRYRVPTVDPILMLGSGVCLAALLGRLRRRSVAGGSGAPECRFFLA